MSSLIGHIAAGSAVFLAQRPQARPAPWPMLAVLVLLAILPDFDYFAYWWFGVDTQPRFTHAMLFGCASATLVWLLWRRTESRPELSALLLASCSHPLLDLLVGVHPVPLFWPFPAAEIASPVGFLPSAGALNPRNMTMWRNLLIETGVLWPALACYVALVRKTAPRVLAWWCALLLPVWLIFLVWSLRIHA